MTTIVKYPDYHPLIGKNYFHAIPGERNGLAVIIPFFNEPSHEIQQTLNSLWLTLQELKKCNPEWRSKPVRILLIQDGWYKSHPSTRKYLQDLFPDPSWWTIHPEFNNETIYAKQTQTFIIQTIHETHINPQLCYSDDGRYLHMDLLIKINNRKKHNSHQWFFGENGYVDAIKPEYIFLTDAFTLYSPKCLYYLTRDLEKNPQYCAVTGRQRIMNRNQQGNAESVFSMSYFLRMVEGFDFELSNLIYNGPFHLGGLLPVIPGPCGLYRVEDITQPEIRSAYFDIVNKEPNETGIILGNLKIAEDRVISYYSVIKSIMTKTMGFNNLAVFYFESETSLKSLMLQRRRWINGSVAGYLYLLFTRFEDFHQWDASFIRKSYIYLLLLFQLFIYMIVSVSPGLNLRILYYGLQYFLELWNISLSWELTPIFIALWGLYISHLLVHYRTPFNYLIMYLLTIVSFTTSLVSYSYIFHYILTQDLISLESLTNLKKFTIYLSFFIFLAPFGLSILFSGRFHSFMYMIKSCLPYVLFLPMMITWFGSYAFSRTHDMTWGNRPSTDLGNISPEQQEIMIIRFKEKSIRINLVLFILNVIMFFIPTHIQLVVILAYFVIVLIYLILSTIYCLIKIPYKLFMSFRQCHRRLNPSV